MSKKQVKKTVETIYDNTTSDCGDDRILTDLISYYTDDYNVSAEGCCGCEKDCDCDECYCDDDCLTSYPTLKNEQKIAVNKDCDGECHDCYCEADGCFASYPPIKKEQKVAATKAYVWVLSSLDYDTYWKQSSAHVLGVFNTRKEAREAKQADLDNFWFDNGNQAKNDVFYAVSHKIEKIVVGKRNF